MAESISWTSLAPDLAQEALPGGMGVVFKASWKRGRTPAPVAIKVLKVGEYSPASVSASITALEREAKLLDAAFAGGCDERIVKTYGIVRGAPTDDWRACLGSFGPSLLGPRGDGELVGIVMRWEPCGTLYTLLHGGVRWAASTVERLRLLERIAEGVELLHDGLSQPLDGTQPQFIVHGDIKSDNVLLSDTRSPRLSDFGLAEMRRATSTLGGGLMSTAPELQKTKNRGTVSYMAPEMFKSGATRSTDVYALGTLAWEVLSNRVPWAGVMSEQRLLELHVDKKNLDFDALPLDVPFDLRCELQRALAFSAKDRPRARELHVALRAARESLEANSFDVFLSHAWAGKVHAPLTKLVIRVLRDSARMRLWIDEECLQHDMGTSMCDGIARSKVVVALISRAYAKSTQCMFELREAKKQGKTVVAAIVDEGDCGASGAVASWWPKRNVGLPEERELAALVGANDIVDGVVQGGGFLFADLSLLARAPDINWASPVLPAKARPLIQANAALPTLLKLLHGLLGRDGACAAVSEPASSYPSSQGSLSFDDDPSSVMGSDLSAAPAFQSGSSSSSVSAVASCSAQDSSGPRVWKMFLCPGESSTALAYRQSKGGITSSDRGKIMPEGPPLRHISPSTHEVAQIDIFTRVDSIHGPTYDRPVGWRMHWRPAGNLDPRAEIKGAKHRGGVFGILPYSMNGIFFATSTHSYRLAPGESIENVETADRGVDKRDGHCPWCVSFIRVTIKDDSGNKRLAPFSRQGSASATELGKHFDGVEIRSFVREPGPVFGFEGGVGDYIDRMEPLQWRLK